MSTEYLQETPDQTKTTLVTVNTRDMEVSGKHIDYDRVTKLAYPNDPGDGSIIYSVSFSNEDGFDGKLVSGEKVDIKEGMVFVVVKSSRS